MPVHQSIQASQKKQMTGTEKRYDCSMRMRFNEAKATEAAAFLLKLRGGRMKYIKLLKLLYLADRKSLLERGRTITSDRYVSMDDGPVLSITYNLIQGDYRNTQHIWSNTIIPAEDFDVRLKDPDADVEVGRLSRSEIETLNSVFDQYGHWNRLETHRFGNAQAARMARPEWKHDPNRNSGYSSNQFSLHLGANGN